MIATAVIERSEIPAVAGKLGDMHGTAGASDRIIRRSAACAQRACLDGHHNTVHRAGALPGNRVTDCCQVLSAGAFLAQAFRFIKGIT